MSRIDEIAADVFRISTYVDAAGLQFNQFLIRDDEPLLYHAGQNALFADILDAVESLVDPGALRWIGLSHFEADECGALNRWLAAAPNALPLAGLVAARTSIDDFAARAPRVLADDEVLGIGRHRLRLLATPHLPHNWEASLLFDETERVLFCSDVLAQHGRTAPVAADVLEHAVHGLEQGERGPMRHAIPYTGATHATFERLAGLGPATLAIMHGASYQGDGAGVLREFGRALARVVGPDRRAAAGR